jgi:hypothetical protein
MRRIESHIDTNAADYKANLPPCPNG